MKAIARSLLCYIFSGGVAYIIDVLLFATLNIWMRLPITFANVSARAVGAVTAYGLNHILTFNRPLAHVKYSAIRYFGLWLVNTSLSTAFLQILNDYSPTSFYTISSKIVIELLLPISNFLVCKFWVFKKP